MKDVEINSTTINIKGGSKNNLHITSSLTGGEGGEEDRLNTKGLVAGDSFIETDDLEVLYEKIIKKDGLELPISLDEAKTKYDGRYSVSYTPSIENTYRPLNNTVRIKAIIRTFGDNYDKIPHINMINIRKFGGNALWTNLY